MHFGLATAHTLQHGCNRLYNSLDRVLARLYVVVRRLVSLNDEVMALKGGPLPEDKIDTLPADGGAPSAPPKKME